MRKYITGLLILGVVGCTTKAPISTTPYLFSIDNQPVLSEEFVYVFTKNRTEDKVLRSEIEDYLELFINFKLKVNEGYSLGLDTTSQYRSEYAEYIDQLTEPYLSNPDLTEELIVQAHERMNEDISVSHLLLTLAPDAEPGDSLEVYNKIQALRKKITEGADFGELASKNSQDPSAQQNKGYLDFFTAFQMVYPFESVAYNTPVGEISQPVRTGFGYHLIKVHERRPSRGERKVSHLMIRNAVDAEEKIFNIHDQLNAGGDWNSLCARFSEDLNTAKKGGELPWFGIRQIVPEIQEAAFGMDSIGQLSDPVQTRFGWHILKLDGKRPIRPIEELRPELEQKVKRLQRSSNLDRDQLIKRLKKENRFIENLDSKEYAISFADSAIIEGTWVIPGSYDDKVLYTMNNEPETISSFFTFVDQQKRKWNGRSPASVMRQLYTEFQENRIIEFEKEQLPSKYEEFRMLEREYREGILLFQMMEDRVWGPASADSVGLRTYFEKNRERYVSSGEIQGIRFSGPKNVLDEVKSTLITMDNSTSIPKKRLDSLINELNSSNFEVRDFVFRKDKDPLYDSILKEPGIQEINGITNVLFYVGNILGPRTLEFEEVRGTLVSDYQEALEKEWITELRSKYEVVINNEELEKLINELQSD